MLEWIKVSSLIIDQIFNYGPKITKIFKTKEQKNKQFQLKILCNDIANEIQKSLLNDLKTVMDYSVNVPLKKENIDEMNKSIQNVIDIESDKMLIKMKDIIINQFNDILIDNLLCTPKYHNLLIAGNDSIYQIINKLYNNKTPLNTEYEKFHLFSTQNAEFRSFVEAVAKQVVLKNPADVEALLEQDSIEESGKKVSEVLIDETAKIGEKLSIRRFVRFETTDGLIEKYIHGDGKIAVLVNLKGGDSNLAKDICMQIAAARPEYLNREAVPQERLDKEMEILKVQAMNEGKPEAIAEKIVQGRIGKFYSEICLVEQEFVKNPDIKVSELLKQNNSEVVEFARLEKGEGIEKKEENFAEEVMKQIK